LPDLGNHLPDERDEALEITSTTQTPDSHSLLGINDYI